MAIEPYLFFEGRAEEAADFYRGALDAEIQSLMRYGESPEPPQMPLPPGSDRKVMHMTLKVGGNTIMGSDGMCSGAASFAGFSLAITAADEAAARRYFAALSEGGQVQMPLARTFFAPIFGIVADKFGLRWMVMANLPPN